MNRNIRRGSEVRKDEILSRESLRETMKSLRINHTQEERMTRSTAIEEKLLSLKEFEEADCVAFYSSTRGEVETSSMIKASIARGKTVAVPKVEGELMTFYKIGGLEELRRGAFGILEPEGDRRSKVEADEINLIIVPGIAFDKSCNRLGYGRGYYDRFLRDQDHMKKIGLAFLFQIVPEIKRRKGDVGMDIVLTEQGIIRCHNSVELENI